MKKFALTLFCFLSFISCSSQQSKNQIFCENELSLLGSFDDLPYLNIDIVELRDSLHSPLDSLFQEDGYFIRYKVDHTVNKSDLILRMESTDITKYPGEPPSFNPYVNWIHIYLQDSDTVLFRRTKSDIDSIDIKVFNWYSELSPERYELVSIALYWDENSDENKLNTIVNESINGYLAFANELSIQRFNKSTCELSANNTDSLSSLLPFQLRTDFFGSEKYDIWDFMPVEIPNEP